MAVRNLTLDQIRHLDGGRVAVAFEQAIAAAVEDCQDRPSNIKSRTVNLQVNLKPRQDESGECYEVVFGFGIKTTVPQANSAAYWGAIRKAVGKKGNVLAFNDLSDDNPSQGTLDSDRPEAWGVDAEDE